MCDKTLNKLYNSLDDPAGLSSLPQLYKRAIESNPRINKAQVESFLRGQDSHTLFKATPNKFQRRPMLFKRPGHTLIGDVMYLKPISPKISTPYCLVLLDGFSRFARIILLKNLKSATVAPLFEKFIIENIYPYRKFFSDLGIEFSSRQMQVLYKNHNIIWYSNPSQHKTSIAERFIRSVKIKLVKFVTHFNDDNISEVIFKFVDAYNFTPHSGLNHEPPINIHLKNSWEDVKDFATVLYKQKHAKIKIVKCPHALNTVVRLKIAARVFGKRATHILNTRELFKVAKVLKTTPITYKVTALDSDEDISGGFYHTELIPVRDTGWYKVQVLKRRKHRGRVLYLINYIDYPGTPAKWVTAKMMKKLHSR